MLFWMPLRLYEELVLMTVHRIVHWTLSPHCAICEQIASERRWVDTLTRT